MGTWPGQKGRGKRFGGHRGGGGGVMSRVGNDQVGTWPGGGRGRGGEVRWERAGGKTPGGGGAPRPVEISTMTSCLLEWPKPDRCFEIFFCCHIRFCVSSGLPGRYLTALCKHNALCKFVMSLFFWFSNLGEWVPGFITYFYEFLTWAPEFL